MSKLPESKKLFVLFLKRWQASQASRVITEAEAAEMLREAVRWRI